MKRKLNFSAFFFLLIVLFSSSLKANNETQITNKNEVIPKNILNDNPLENVIYSTEFKKFATNHNINFSKLAKANYKLSTILNSEVYEYKLKKNKDLFIVKNKYDNSLSYYYRILEGNEYIILDKNSNNIMQSIISNEHVQGGQVDCIKDTVAYIKNACEQSVSCSVACDLSPNCTTYMYIIAAAHCAASGNKPPTQLIAAD